MEKTPSPSTTKNTKIHATTYRTCAVAKCLVEADLVAISSSYHGLRIDFYICQKHLGGRR